jgi:hypothetical protein
MFSESLFLFLSVFFWWLFYLYFELPLGYLFGTFHVYSYVRKYCVAISMIDSDHWVSFCEVMASILNSSEVDRGYDP